MPTTSATTLAWRTRLRAAATAGGLAVLLGGSLAGHLPSASAAPGAVHVLGVAPTATGLSAVTGTLGAVARTGGQR